MSGFEFTPGGLVAIAPIQTTLTPLAPVAEARPAPAPRAVKAPPLPRANTSPVDVIKLAKARLREVEREIKRLHRLERERDELRRLLDAATNKPRAIVREIKAARG